MLRDIADDVDSWTCEGVSDKAVDARIVAWLDDHDMGFAQFNRDLEADGLLAAFPGLNVRHFWEVFGLERWFIDCVRSIAFTDEPIPFHPWAGGFWYEDPNTDPPTLVAVLTPLSDPDVAARQLKEKFKAMFGTKAARKTRSNEVATAKVLRMHHEGMSYTDIAVQNLRSAHPDIVKHPYRYKVELNRERGRVIKEIAAAEKVWKERLPESSIEE